MTFQKRIRYKKKCLEEDARRKEKAKRLKQPKQAPEELERSPPKPILPQNVSYQPAHYENIKLVNLQILTPSIQASLSKNVITSPFPFYDATPNLNPPTNLPPLQVNKSPALPSLPGISNFDPFFDSAPMSVPVPSFSDQDYLLSQHHALWKESKERSVIRKLANNAI